MPRGRKSPLNLDGTSICFTDPDATGRPTICKARAKDEHGRWQSKRFPVLAWDRDGVPTLPEAAETWARGTRKSFIKGEAVAGAATFREYADLVADNVASTGATAGRVALIRAVGRVADADGIRDMKADTFPTRIRSWLASLKTGWSLPTDAPNRRKNPKPLSPATRNKLLIICRMITGLAVQRRRLAYDPLVEIARIQEPDFIKPVFSIEELRRMVSDQARNHAASARAELEAAISTRMAHDGTGRVDAIKAIAAERGQHWASIYNALAREPKPDPMWLATALMVYTGARADEAMHLRWEWIKWNERIITLELSDDYASKSDAERLIPLEPELFELLRPLAKLSGHILPDDIRAGGSGIRVHEKTKKGGGKDYTAALRRYLHRIGIEPGERTAHSLRHSFISIKLARADTNVERLRKAVGHADFATTMGYGRTSQRFEHEVDKWPDSSLWLRRPLPVIAADGKAVVK